MRPIKRHIIHCSASMHGDAETIDRWHRERGWGGIGYHWVITRAGIIEQGRPMEKQGAHVRGHNADSIGTCLIGEDKMTPNQMHALEVLHELLSLQFGDLKLCGHNEYSNKSCPGSTVTQWIKERRAECGQKPTNTGATCSGLEPASDK